MARSVFCGTYWKPAWACRLRAELLPLQGSQLAERRRGSLDSRVSIVELKGTRALTASMLLSANFRWTFCFFAGGAGRTICRGGW